MIIQPASSPHTPDPSHCSAEDVAAYVDGTLEESARPQIIGHLATCAICRSEAQEVRQMLRRYDAQSRAPRRGLGTRAWWVLGSAAAATVLISLGRLASGRETESERSVAGPLASDLQRPVGSMDAQSTPLRVTVDRGSPAAQGTGQPRRITLHWSGDSLATQYAFTLYDEQGGLVQQERLADTVWQLDVARLAKGRSYFWSVDAMRRDGRVRSSGMQHLVLP